MKTCVVAFLGAALMAAPLSARAADFLRLTDAGAEPVEEKPASLFLHGGLSGIVMNEGAKISAAGLRLSGADIAVAPQYTFGFEAGLYLTPNLAVALSGGIPPRATIKGAGALRGMGVLGSAVYGPAALLAQYHFTGLGAFQPYLGIGPTYMMVFSERDGALAGAKVLPAFGVAGQVGANIMFSSNWGVFADLKYAYLRTKAKGFLGPAPVSAEAKLDPFVFSTGITYKY